MSKPLTSHFTVEETKTRGGEYPAKAPKQQSDSNSGSLDANPMWY